LNETNPAISPLGSPAPTKSNHNPLNLIERYLIIPPVVEPRRPRRGMGRDDLRLFERTIVQEVRRDAGGTERVASDAVGDGLLPEN
jgi:hypothetical protein